LAVRNVLAVACAEHVERREAGTPDVVVAHAAILRLLCEIAYSIRRRPGGGQRFDQNVLAVVEHMLSGLPRVSSAALAGRPSGEPNFTPGVVPGQTPPFGPVHRRLSVPIRQESSGEAPNLSA
jgi:hypothetical protein